MNFPNEDPVIAQELGHIINMRRNGVISPLEARGLGEVVRTFASPAMRDAIGERIATELNETHPNSIDERDPDGNLRTLVRYDIRNPDSVRGARDWLINAYASDKVTPGTHTRYLALFDDVLANP